jgi:competence protein ComEA
LTGLTRGEQWALLGLIGLILLGMLMRDHIRPGSDELSIKSGGQWIKLADYGAEPDSAQSPPPTVQASQLIPALDDSGGLDLNTATAADLDRLPRIGPARASAIIQHRDQIGGYTRVEELTDVPGIGDKTLLQLKNFLKIVNSPETSSEQPTTGTSVSVDPATIRSVIEMSPAGGGTSSAGKVNINSATLDELVRLHGVGRKKAQRIINERTMNGPFRHPAELARVSGIGGKTVQKNLHLITTQ